MIPLVLSAALAWATCEPPKLNPPDAPLQARAPALGHVSLEIPLVGNASAPEELLTVLDDRNIKVTLLPSRTWASRQSRFLKGASENGHDVGIWFSFREDLGLTSNTTTEPEFSDWIGALRNSRRTVRRIVGINPTTVGIAYLPVSGELAIEAMGFRTIYPSERTIDDIPRRARSTSSTAGRARIVGYGPYTDGCGSLLPHWSPASLDRATGAAARGHWVRIGLPPDDSAVRLLETWLDEVVIPMQWPVMTAHEMTQQVRRGLAPSLPPPPDVAVAKSVPEETWKAVAQMIAENSTLPRELTGGLNLTEAFFGMVTMVGTTPTPNQVTLGKLDGPSEVAPTGLRSPKTFDPESVRLAAQEILQRLGGRVPALIDIDSATLTAAEALQLMARVYLGEDAVAEPVTDPDPYAQGGGWGSSDGL